MLGVIDVSTGIVPKQYEIFRHPVTTALETDDGLTAEAADDLCALYEPYPAWGERTREEVANIVRNSDEVVGIRKTGTDSLVAAARVLTDHYRQRWSTT